MLLPFPHHTRAKRGTVRLTTTSVDTPSLEESAALCPGPAANSRAVPGLPLAEFGDDLFGVQSGFAHLRAKGVLDRRPESPES